MVLKPSLRRNTLSSSDEYASDGDLGSLSSSDFLPSSCNKRRGIFKTGTIFWVLLFGSPSYRYHNGFVALCKSHKKKRFEKRKLLNWEYYEFTSSQHDQLPVGLIAQLLEHCTGIAEVMGSNPVQACIFFRLSFRI